MYRPDRSPSRRSRTADYSPSVQVDRISVVFCILYPATIVSRAEGSTRRLGSAGKRGPRGTGLIIVIVSDIPNRFLNRRVYCGTAIHVHRICRTATVLILGNQSGGQSVSIGSAVRFTSINTGWIRYAVNPLLRTCRQVAVSNIRVSWSRNISERRYVGGVRGTAAHVQLIVDTPDSRGHSGSR